MYKSRVTNLITDRHFFFWKCFKLSWLFEETSLCSFFCFCGYAFYALRLLSIHFVHRNALRFSNESLRPTYFFATAKKSKQKRPLEGNTLHPIILWIKQGSIGFLRSTASPSWTTWQADAARASFDEPLPLFLIIAFFFNLLF